MLFVGHLTLGVLAFLLAQPYLIGNQVLLFLTVLLGSLLPDIDEENSRICKWSGPIGKLVAKTFPHRGFIHSLLFFAILYLLDYTILQIEKIKFCTLLNKLLFLLSSLILFPLYRTANTIHLINRTYSLIFDFNHRIKKISFNI